MHQWSQEEEERNEIRTIVAQFLGLFDNDLTWPLLFHWSQFQPSQTLSIVWNGRRARNWNEQSLEKVITILMTGNGWTSCIFISGIQSSPESSALWIKSRFFTNQEPMNESMNCLCMDPLDFMRYLKSLVLGHNQRNLSPVWAHCLKFTVLHSLLYQGPIWQTKLESKTWTKTFPCAFTTK